MSTRGLFGFRKNSIDKAVYHHFDSYPEGLGAAFAGFISDTAPRLPEFFDHIKEINPEIEPTAEQIEYCKKMGWINTSVSTRDLKDWYCLLRETQGLDVWEKCILKDADMFIDNYIDFIKDSLFCEYAYIYDIDEQILEFYKGFQKEPDDDNRYGNTPNSDDGRGYYPCKKVGEFSLDELSDVDAVVKYMRKMVNN